MKIEVSTSAYEFAHCKKPRGIGAWAFELICKDRVVTVFHRGSYSECVKRAQQDAKVNGAFLIKVGS